MKRCLRWLLLVILVLYTAPRNAPSQTQAFIPSDDGNVTRVDTTDETFDTVEFSGSDSLLGAAVTPNGVYLLVTNRGDLSNPGTLTLVTTTNFLSTGAQFDRTVGVDPRGVAVDSSGGFAYVANFVDNTLTRFDMALLSVSGDPIDVGNGPFGVAAYFDEVDDLTRVYVSNNTDNTVSVIHDDGDTATLEVEVNVGTSPVGIAVTPDGSLVYVANNGSDNVSIIQTSDNTVLGTLGVGVDPWGVAVGSDGDFVFVTNSGSDTVSVIDTATQTVRNTFSTGNQPMGVAAPKNGDFAYAVNQLDDSISRIDMGTTTVTTIGSGEINNASALGAFIGGTPPIAPSGLTATADSSDKIELSWTDNDDEELGFKIERREDSEDNFTQVATVDADETTFSDNNVTDETTYHYRVRAFNEVAESAFTAEANATTEEGSFAWCFIHSLIN